MQTTLTLSSQGQIVIPSKVRMALRLKPGNKLHLKLKTTGEMPQITLTPQPESWVNLVAGKGKGIWGNAEKYIEKQRKSWEK